MKHTDTQRKMIREDLERKLGLLVDKSVIKKNYNIIPYLELIESHVEKILAERDAELVKKIGETRAIDVDKKVDELTPERKVWYVGGIHEGLRYVKELVMT